MINDLIPFFSISSMYVFVFSMILIIMEADYSDESYESVPRLLKIFIQTLRNSLGDI